MLNKNSTLLLAFLVAAVRSQDPCAQCSGLSLDRALCVRDGLLYPSLACAQFAGKENFEFFTCKPGEQLACAQTCKDQTRIYKCQAECTEPYKFRFTCNNNGRVYSNRCRESCVSGDFKDTFSCDQFASFAAGSCNVKCDLLARCKKDFAAQPAKPICGRDGLLYNSVEELRCNGDFLVIQNENKEPIYDGTSNCLSFVEVNYGKPVGVKPRV